MHRHMVVFFCLATLTMTAGCHERVEPKPPEQTEFERNLAPRVVPSFDAVPRWTVEERMAHHNVPGLSVAVFENGSVSWQAAYGVADTETGRLLTPETNFQAASISKAITAFAAMRLVEEETLSLDDPVNTMLTSWQLEENALTAQTPVTLRHLLSHMGGLNVSGFAGYADGEDLPVLHQILSGTPPAKNERIAVVEAPGQRIRYSGGGTQIVQALITDRTGDDYGQVVQRTVFDPVGMRRAHVTQPLPEHMRAHSARGHAGPASTPIAGFSHTYRERAAGGVWANPGDLALLGIAFADVLGGGEDGFIAPATAREMTRRQFNDRGSLGAFVWDMPDGQMFGHTGGNAGYRNNFYGFTDGRGGAVIMTNADNGFSLIWEVMAALARTYGWSYGATEIRQAIPTAPEVAEALTGTYRTELSWIGDLWITIEHREDGLWLSAPPVLSDTPLYHQQGNSFFLNTGSRIVVTYDENGRVASFDAELEEGLHATRATPPAP